MNLLRWVEFGHLAGDETDGTGVRGRNEDVVQAHLAEQRQRARQAGALLHQEWRAEHEGPQIQPPAHARLRHIPV